MSDGEWVERPRDWTMVAGDQYSRTILRCPKCNTETIVLWNDGPLWYWQKERRCGRRCKYAALEAVRDEVWRASRYAEAHWRPRQEVVINGEEEGM